MMQLDIYRRPLALEQLVARPQEQRHIGPFWLLKQLGHGSFAPVWLAHESYGQTLVRMAAVKLFALGSVGTKGQERIVREAQALCQVEHPNVVRFYALPIDEEAGVGGLAMEHVPGASLGQRIAAEGPLAPDEVIRIGIAMASALDAVHRAGLVHRDVKPDNMVESGSVYKLIDFGIAQGEFAPLTKTEPTSNDSDDLGTMRQQHGPSGTPGYVDPECYLGLPANFSSDLYALGATLHVCLAGHPPTVSDRQTFAEMAPTVPRALAALISELLAPLRKDRPRSASVVRDRLLAMIKPRAVPVQRTRAKKVTIVVVLMMVTTVVAIFLPALWSVESSGKWSRGGAPWSYTLDAQPDDPDGQVKGITLRAHGLWQYRFGTLTSSMSAKPWRGKRIRMSADVNTGGVKGWTGLWLRLDGRNQELLGFDNMHSRPIKGDTDKRRYEVVLDVPAETALIVYGLILNGPGWAHLQNLQFEEVGKDVPTTDSSD